jgi:hypothetical protein
MDFPSVSDVPTDRGYPAGMMADTGTFAASPTRLQLDLQHFLRTEMTPTSQSRSALGPDAAVTNDLYRIYQWEIVK